MPPADPGQISLMKAVVWEEAKGKLRAVVSAAGQCSPMDEPAGALWSDLRERVEAFIKDVEGDGLHE
jgi:hypothetical protein